MKPSTALARSESRNPLASEPSNSIADGALVTHIAIIDEVLDGHASEIGNDLAAYRNHVYRVVNSCVGMVESGDGLEKIATAAVFHDLGIWTDRTFDYIAPSIALARKYLIAHSREDYRNFNDDRGPSQDQPVKCESTLARRAIPASRLD